MAIKRFAGLAWIAAMVAACAAPPSPAPTTCGGSDVWPPPHEPAGTEVIDLQLIAPTTVRLTNLDDAGWTVRVAPWVLASCVGWIAFGNTEGSRFELAPGSTADRTVTFEPGFETRRIGVEAWDHECGDGCTDPPDAFLSVAPTSVASPSVVATSVGR